MACAGTEKIKRRKSLLCQLKNLVSNIDIKPRSRAPSRCPKPVINVCEPVIKIRIPYCLKPVIKVCDPCSPKPDTQLGKQSCPKPVIKICEPCCLTPVIKICDPCCPEPITQLGDRCCPKPSIKICEPCLPICSLRTESYCLSPCCSSPCLTPYCSYDSACYPFSSPPPSRTCPRPIRVTPPCLPISTPCSLPCVPITKPCLQEQPCIPCNPPEICYKVSNTCSAKECKSREIIGGKLYVCDCIKRNGLQDDCPRSGCQGSPACLTQPEPMCGPAQAARKHGIPKCRNTCVNTSCDSFSCLRSCYPRRCRSSGCGDSSVCVVVVPPCRSARRGDCGIPLVASRCRC